MEFIEAYKRLEKLCGDMLRDVPSKYGPVKTYYDLMVQNARGAAFVPGWNQDYEKLKYYCWVRNQIAHMPGCTEENMCRPEDAAWLEAFCDRIIQQTDPLALYRKDKQQRALARQQKAAAQPKPAMHQSAQMPACKRKIHSNQWAGYVGFLIALVSLIAIVVILMQM